MYPEHPKCCSNIRMSNCESHCIMLGQLLGWKVKVALSLLEHIADLLPVLFHCEGSD